MSRQKLRLFQFWFRTRYLKGQTCKFCKLLNLKVSRNRTAPLSSMFLNIVFSLIVLQMYNCVQWIFYLFIFKTLTELTHSIQHGHGSFIWCFWNIPVNTNEFSCWHCLGSEYFASKLQLPSPYVISWGSPS